MKTETIGQKTRFVVGNGNVFADLGLDDADEQLAKAQMVARIRQIIQERGLNQTQATEVLGTTQTRVSELRNGKVARTTCDRLLGFLNAVDCDVSIRVTPRRDAGSRSRGKTLVVVP